MSETKTSIECGLKLKDGSIVIDCLMDWEKPSPRDLVFLCNGSDHPDQLPWYQAVSFAVPDDFEHISMVFSDRFHLPKENDINRLLSRNALSKHGYDHRFGLKPDWYWSHEPSDDEKRAYAVHFGTGDRKLFGIENVKFRIRLVRTITRKEAEELI